MRQQSEGILYNPNVYKSIITLKAISTTGGVTGKASEK